MTEAIIVALITGIFALLGTVMTVSSGFRKTEAMLETQNAVQNERIDTLTREVRKHNEFAERIPRIEERIEQVEKRVDKLES